MLYLSFLKLNSLFSIVIWRRLQNSKHLSDLFFCFRTQTGPAWRTKVSNSAHYPSFIPCDSVTWSLLMVLIFTTADNLKTLQAFLFLSPFGQVSTVKDMHSRVFLPSVFTRLWNSNKKIRQFAPNWLVFCPFVLRQQIENLHEVWRELFKKKDISISNSKTATLIEVQSFPFSMGL